MSDDGTAGGPGAVGAVDEPSKVIAAEGYDDVGNIQRRVLPVEWTPIFERGDGIWVGIDQGSQISVGSREKVKARVGKLGFIPLWPMLEQSFASSHALLLREWSRLDPENASSPEQLIEEIIKSAACSESDYWVEKAVQWISEIEQDCGFDEEIFASLLKQVYSTRHLSQSVRHKAHREAKRRGRF